jgi:tetratricopeptide (TPR) repeat protein
METTPPPDIAATPSRLRRLWGQGVAAWQLANRLALTVLPIFLGAAAVALVLREAARQPIEVATLSAPGSPAETGMTGDVLALRLLDAIEAAARAVHTETMHRPMAELEGSQPDINIPVAGVSLRSVAGMVRGLLGWPERRLSGEVVAAGDQLRLRLRLAGHGVVADVESPAAAGADALLALAAPEVWRVVSPRLYAWHVALSVGEPAAIRDRLAQLRRHAPDAETEATITYLVARSLVQSGEAAEALRMLDALVAQSPGYAAAHYGRALALRALRRPEEALVEQERGMALDPGSGWAQQLAAALLREMGRLQPALDAARRAQALDDDDRPGLVEESRVLGLMGRAAEAVAAARRAIALDPRFAPALSALGHALVTQRDDAAALTAFEQAIGVAPSLAEAHAGRGQVLARLGRTQEALEALARSIALDEVDHHPHAVRGEVLRGLQQWAEAVEAFDAALARAPDRAPLHLGRAVALLNLGRADAALEALRRAQALGLDDDTTRALLAEATSQAAPPR